MTLLKEQKLEPKNIAVIGLGYVGCVTAACLAKLGHWVTGVDTDEFKVRNVMAGNAPFYEPGLEGIVRSDGRFGSLESVLFAGRRSCRGRYRAHLRRHTVGSQWQSRADQLRRVSEEIAAHLPARTRQLIVVIRSTVFPGTCEDVVMGAMRGSRIHHRVKPGVFT